MHRQARALVVIDITYQSYRIDVDTAGAASNSGASVKARYQCHGFSRSAAPFDVVRGRTGYKPA